MEENYCKRAMEYVNSPSGAFPLIGLGTFSIPHVVLEELIPAALDLGYTLFDTAYKYQNEAVLGRLLQESSRNRTAYLIETKVCAEQLLGNLRYLRLNAKSLKHCFRLASRNLLTDCIDVWMLHSTFPGYERYVSQLLEWKKRGKIKRVGICNLTLQQLKDLKDIVGCYPDIVQCEIHPYYANKELILFCKNNGILVEARSPFAHGDAMNEWLKEDILLALAAKYKKSIHQIILRWIVQQNIIALPRTSNLEHLRENINIFDFSLLEEEMIAIDGLNKNLSFGVISTRMQ